jgi:hypothetical protein
LIARRNACALLTGILPLFKQRPCCLTYFLATAQESRQRKPLSNQFFNPPAYSASKVRAAQGNFPVKPSPCPDVHVWPSDKPNNQLKNWSREDKNIVF